MMMMMMMMDVVSLINHVVSLISSPFSVIFPYILNYVHIVVRFFTIAFTL